MRTSAVAAAASTARAAGARFALSPPSAGFHPRSIAVTAATDLLLGGGLRTTTPSSPSSSRSSAGPKAFSTIAASASSSSRSAFDETSRRHRPNEVPWRFLSSHPSSSSGGGGGSRSSSSSSAAAAAARDTRVAGRRRFYKVASISGPSPSPPWDHFDPEALVQLERAQKTAKAAASEREKDGEGGDGGMVDNPISAGVDGTDSATGVTLDRPTREAMRIALEPRSAALSLEKLLSSDDEPPVEASGAGGGGAEWYAVTLDTRPLRTPLGCPLLVPSATLALAIASEWESQMSVIRPAQMPLMTLACTSLDQTSADPNTVIENVLRYLRNDTTCYRTDPSEDRVLSRKQGRAWDTLHDWAATAFGARPATAVGDEAILIGRGTRAKLERGYSPGLPHPPELERNVERWIRSLDAWHLTALQAVTVEAKSLLVGAAVVAGASSHPGDEEGISGANKNSVALPYQSHTRDAIHACRVEEEFQIENWGLVEGGHDYDRLNASVGVHAASVMVGCVSAEGIAH